MGILPDTSPMSPEICGNPHRLQISVAFDSPQYDVINATLARPPAFPQHLTSPLSIVSQGRAPFNTENPDFATFKDTKAVTKKKKSPEIQGNPLFF
jgi:hypothetical protein